MAKEKNSKHPKNEPEEYKFSEEEYGAEPVEKAPRKSLIKQIFGRRVVIVLVLIIAVLVVYQFVKPPTVKKEIQTLERQPVIQPTTTATLTPTPVAMPTIEPSQSQEISGEVQQQVSSLAQQTQQTQSQLGQLQQGVQQLQGQLAQVNNQMTNLASSVKTCVATQCAPKVVAPVVVKPARKIAVIRPPVYYVRAVVPGRAWLYTKRGNTIVHLTTVRVGDFLQGYGRIQAISPSQGKVWTSWGNVIRYGVNDS